MNSLAGWVAAVVSGTMLWSVACLSLGGREAWDTPAYWSLWYPLALLICAALGFFFPVRPWRWPLAVLLVQLPVMAFIADGDAGLLPLGIILLIVLSVPAMLAAAIGMVVASRRGRTGDA